jgi:hypothetical protein
VSPLLPILSSALAVLLFMPDIMLVEPRGTNEHG